MTDTEIDALVKQLIERAKEDRQIQSNNEAVAVALKGQRLLFDQGFRSQSNTFAVRLGLDYENCAKKDAQLASEWEAAADAIITLRAQLAEITSDLASVQAAYVAESDAHEVTKAALAAQIEDACAVLDAHSEYDQTLCCDGRECGCQGASVHDVMKHFIRSQPHDSTALDRMMRAEREKALRDAADMVGAEAKTFPVNVAWAVEDLGTAILAMIETEPPNAS